MLESRARFEIRKRQKRMRKTGTVETERRRVRDIKNIYKTQLDADLVLRIYKEQLAVQVTMRFVLLSEFMTS